MISRIDDFFNLRQQLLDTCLDAMLQGDIYHSTSMAATAKAKIHLVVFHTVEVDSTAM